MGATSAWHWRALSAAFVAIVAVVLLAPILIVMWLSVGESAIMSFPPRGFTLRWFLVVFEDPIWTERLVASLQVGVVSGLAATVVGTSLALGLHRSTVRGKRLILGIGLLPLIIPSVTIGIGMYLVWVEGWTIGSLSLGGRLNGTLAGYVLAHTVLAVPYSLITVTASLLTVDRNLENAASTLGAGPWSTFRRITLPLILPGVVAGLVLSFLTSWDEVVVASFLATPTFSTVPVQLFDEVQQSPTPTAAALCTMLIIAALLLLSLVAVVQRRGTSDR